MAAKPHVNTHNLAVIFAQELSFDAKLTEVVQSGSAQSR